MLKFVECRIVTPKKIQAKYGRKCEKKGSAEWNRKTKQPKTHRRCRVFQLHEPQKINLSLNIYIKEEIFLKTHTFRGQL